MHHGQVSPSTVARLQELTTACSGYDFKLANTYHVAMVNVDWNDHKDWLKGVRNLITIGLKKYPTAA